MPLVRQREEGGDGLKVARFWQFWDEGFGVDVDPLSARTGAQVEVQAALELLFYELGVGRDVAERIESGEVARGGRVKI